MDNREQLLKSLISFKGDFEEIVKNLSEYPWDSEKELVVLCARDIINVIDLTLKSGDLKKMGQWAEAIELRDDIGYENHFVKEVIERLANPILYDLLDLKQIFKLKIEMESKPK